MYELPKVSEERLQELRCYPGLVGILIYSPIAKVFESKIRDAYQELHVQSGCTLVVLTGAANWLSNEDRQTMRRDVLSRMRPRGKEGLMNMMVGLESKNRFDAAEDMLTLQRRYGIKLKELPCLLLLEDILRTDGYAFSLDKETVDAANDDLANDLAGFFQVCNETMAEKKCPVSAEDAAGSEAAYSQLVEWRAETMGRAIPTLNLIRTFKVVRKIAPAVVGNLLQGAVGLVT